METIQKGIIEQEQGILKKEGIYFFSVSAFAQENLFYPHWGAEYVCTPSYRVERDERDVFDAFILFYIVRGSMGVQYLGQTFSAKAGDIVLLDCKVPNQYWAETQVQFRWIHFGGSASQAYCDMLYERQWAHFPNHSDLGVHFFNILHGIRAGDMNEHYYSIQLQTVLGGLATAQDARRCAHPAVAAAKQYMEQHFAEALTLEELSKVVILSKYHFARLFRAETGMSVHGYLLNLRMNQAKKLLSETLLSVEEVGQQCGFSSTSHFIRAFKQMNHFTPYRFRSLLQ